MSINEQETPEEKLLKALFGNRLEKNESQEEKETGSPSIPKYWEELVTINNIKLLQTKLIKHLSVLVDSPECQGILTDIINRVREVEIVDNRLTISILTISGNIGKLVCSAPSERDISILPESYQEILKLHDGFSFPDYGAAAFDTTLGISTPVFLNGEEVFTMFEPDSTGEDEFVVVIDTHQDWFILDTQTKLSIDKPAIKFLSHGNSKSKNISKNYSIGGHFLRLIALTIIGEEDSRLKLFRHL